ncbi:MAG: hypothetical protein ED556_00510 [Winogradskyella sp.]|uniref:DoxX family protein n=1 Tax=Winogradskyella sp. TaxID=1883156 RepID=UPI000F41AB08|nr:DoxX family protein [Winogradskyella sp.]RNC87704.1 MAG: hypothetical protein ED556_00510 [Winogradskyella sp.]
MILDQTYKENWSSLSKLIFRFIFTYFSLYILLMFTSALLETPFRWIGKTFLGLNYEYDVSGYGSGDNTFAYITLFVNFALSIIITLIWSLVDKKRPSYNRGFYWFLVVIRVFIILAMLLYGFVKVFQIQFQPASFVKLLQPLGEFSPMGLAWQYMGYSKGFGMFAGFMEIIGGLLLIWRRTSTLGAFIVMGVMTQVAMMNLMFDIPVKIFSIHLILMAGVIFVTDIKRFVSVFFKNKAVESYDYYYPVTSKSYYKTIGILKKILLSVAIIAGCVLGYLAQLNISDVNHRPKLYGIWETQTYIKNNDTIPPMLTDSERWRYLLIERKDRAIVKTMTDDLIAYTFVTDSIENKITVYNEDSEKDSFFDFELVDSDVLKLWGTLENDSLAVIFKRKELNDFTLKSRKFNWINERPYNN